LLHIQAKVSSPSSPRSAFQNTRWPKKTLAIASKNAIMFEKSRVPLSPTHTSFLNLLSHAHTPSNPIFTTLCLSPIQPTLQTKALPKIRPGKTIELWPKNAFFKNRTKFPRSEKLKRCRIGTNVQRRTTTTGKNLPAKHAKERENQCFSGGLGRVLLGNRTKGFLDKTFSFSRIFACFAGTFLLTFSL